MSTAIPTFVNVDPDEMFVCPYDPVHRISAKRFTYHLMKCRRNYSSMEFVRCPFNARHEMPKEELDFHVARCPDKNVIRQDIERETAEPQVFRTSNRPVTPPPTNREFGGDDWDLEADNQPFVAPIAVGLTEERGDSISVIQNLQQVQQQLHGSGEPVPVNLADMTPAQRKNYKRAQKRQQKRQAETGDEMGEAVASEAERRQELMQQYSILMNEGGFVDFVSILNQWCQKNKVNPPKYTEGPGVAGGFGSKVVIRTDVFSTNKYCKTKKDAKQNAAMVAVVALNVPIGEEGHDKLLGLRARSTAEKDRLRQVHEEKLLMQAGYNNPAPVLHPPSSFAARSQPIATAPPAYSEPATAYTEMDRQMGDMSLGQQSVDDEGWSTVAKKNPTGVKNPVYNTAMKVAGRGRGARR
ncbi:protein D7 isoform X2 [Nematostella vectensis]|uniref:protein D7 isoform X2 n=1 Tax=Nematostella vectensis TaxID=45351 RepID=UPI002077230E|nr:protein D7 isoform X2 [Nematostella vectensis]